MGRRRAIFFFQSHAKFKISERYFMTNSIHAHKVQNVFFSHSDMERDNMHCVIKTEEVGYKTEVRAYMFLFHLHEVVQASDWWISAYWKIKSLMLGKLFMHFKLTALHCAHTSRSVGHCRTGHFTVDNRNVFFFFYNG